MHRGDDRHLAFVDGLEGGEAALVGANERRESLGALHLLDVDARVEAAALGAEHDAAHVGVLASGGDLASELEPAGHIERVDRRSVDYDLSDTGVVNGGGDAGQGAPSVHGQK